MYFAFPIDSLTLFLKAGIFCVDFENVDNYA